ncbi:hypothetical protein WAI453_001679 [Rhynchosporium graminicola]
MIPSHLDPKGVYDGFLNSLNLYGSHTHNHPPNPDHRDTFESFLSYEPMAPLSSPIAEQAGDERSEEFTR